MTDHPHALTPPEIHRCAWATGDPLMIRYHDEQWGVPVHDDRLFFEMLCLEGAQAGLSWLTVLRKREAYLAAFDGFDPARVAAYDSAKVAELLENPQIIRNRAKIAAFITNAHAFLAIQKEFGRFDTYIWGFVSGQPLREHAHPAEVLTIRETMSKALKKRGFAFVGPTICQAFMQSTGLVNAHTPDCFRY